jgi:pyruvate dehydrogenase E1 component
MTLITSQPAPAKMPSNLQRLDGPVTGNGKIINELEGIFAGAGWEVIKVIFHG